MIMSISPMLVITWFGLNNGYDSEIDLFYFAIVGIYLNNGAYEKNNSIA